MKLKLLSFLLIFIFLTYAYTLSHQKRHRDRKPSKYSTHPATHHSKNIHSGHHHKRHLGHHHKRVNLFIEGDKKKADDKKAGDKKAGDKKADDKKADDKKTDDKKTDDKKLTLEQKKQKQFRKKLKNHKGKSLDGSINKHKKIKTIPFSSPASKVNRNINSIGEPVLKSVALSSFPFHVTRCDQLVLFPCNYINDEDDYRVRRKGFVAITAHYTNLFEGGKDGQKLIQQIISSSMPSDPIHITGARGCIRVHGGAKQRNIDVCVPSLGYAQNLINVYETFARCRVGDNLAPIPPWLLKQLLQMCHIDRAVLSGPVPANLQAMSKLASKMEKKNKKSTKSEAYKLLHRGGAPPKKKKMSATDRKKWMKWYLKHKKKKPTYHLPSMWNNQWEQDRRRYVPYQKIKVPGTRRR